MGSSVWFYIFAFVTIAVVIDGVVKIIKASKGSRSKELQNAVDEIEDDLAKVEQDLEDARNRRVMAHFRWPVAIGEAVRLE